MSAKLLTESKIFAAINKTCDWYWRIEEKLNTLYLTSSIYEISRKCTDAVKKYFSFSDINIISKIEKSACIKFMESSIFVNYLKRQIKKLSMRIGTVFSSSKILRSTQDMLEELFQSHFNAIGIMICAAVLTNAVISIAYDMRVNIFGWAIRGSFLFSGLAALFCTAGVKDVIKSSIVYKILSHHGKR